jgi:hypothetical protein
MRGYGKDGSDLERMQPGDTDTAKKIKQMAESRDFMKQFPADWQPAYASGQERGKVNGEING